MRLALEDAETADQSGGGDAVVPEAEGQQLEAAAGGEDESIKGSEELLSGWLENEAAVWEHGESAVKARQAQQHAQRACAAVQKERTARMCPVMRSRWTPEHRAGVQDGILVPRSGKGRNYHYFQRCPALQWGHCEVPVHEAVSEGCAECTLCRQQQREQAAAWAGMSGFPADAWRQSAAPAWVDPMAGDASWVVKEADVKVLHWMCAVRELDAGGSNEEMVRQLHDWDERASSGRNEDALQREWGPPPPYEEEDQEEGRRCVMAPICEHDEDSAMAIVVQVDGDSALGGLDTWAEASVIRRGRVKKHWKVHQRDGKAFDGLGSTGVKLGEEVEVPVQMRYGSELIHVAARVVEDSEMPGGADMLFGTAFQRKARMVYDCDNMRVELRTLGTVIDLETMHHQTLCL